MAIPIRTASEVNVIGRALPAIEGEIAVPLPGGYRFQFLWGEVHCKSFWANPRQTSAGRPR